MLVLTRKLHEGVVVNRKERVEVFEIKEKSVRVKVNYLNTDEPDQFFDLEVEGEPISLRSGQSTVQLVKIFSDPPPKVRLGFDVPKDEVIHRDEMFAFMTGCRPDDNDEQDSKGP